MPLLKINPEFKDLIPPLNKDEYTLLEQSILCEGCRDTIKIWNDVIIDGHNRYEICVKHGLPYKTKAMKFSSKSDAKAWIIDYQLGRRNLPDAAYIELAMQKVEMGYRGNNKTGEKRKIVAQLAGKSESNIHRYITIRKLGDTDLLEAVKKGEVTIGSAYKELEKGKAPRLEVITKTVEDLCPGWVPKTDGRHIAAVLMKNVKKLEALYGFYFDYCGLALGENYDAVRKRLKGLLGLIEGCNSVPLSDETSSG